MADIIEARNLVKRYPEVEAVGGVSFSVDEGTCFGLLGPNGAGKTTTVEILEGITAPTEGEVLYRGRPLAGRFRQEAGIQFQSTALQDFLTVRETLRLFQSLYERTTPLAEIIQICSLGDLLNCDTRKLSGGQRQRLLLAIALVNDPSVVFLDEPTTGLDPQSRRNFWDLIKDIKGRGKSILLTTHYMEEAYRLCDSIAIMDHGRIIAHGSPEALLKSHFDHVILRLPADDLGPAVDDLPFPVAEAHGVVELTTGDVNGVVRLLIDKGVSLSRLRVRPPTLEDLFLALTGSELRT